MLSAARSAVEQVPVRFECAPFALVACIRAPADQMPASKRQDTMAPEPVGLSTEEAVRRQRETGLNGLPAARTRTVWVIVLETMREPMFLLLVGAAVLYLVLGDLGEGLFLTAGAAASIGLVVAQEARSENALSALRSLSQPMARVLRDGDTVKLPAREIVPGDILIVGEGERIVCDGELVGGDLLTIDESVLTGESATVTRSPGDGSANGESGGASGEPGAHDGSKVLAGSLIVRGQALMRATDTGERSALGRIGKSLANIQHESTPLQRTTARLVGWLSLAALAFCAVVAVAYGVLRSDWTGGALAGITVAIALIPEEFPMVLAVFMALGAFRLAGHNVLVRRSAVIETLGAASVLCVDKTGTLTENQMRIARLWAGAADLDVDGEQVAHDTATFELLRLADLASSVHAIDPMDRAVRRLSEASKVKDGRPTHPERTWPVRADLQAMIQAWRMPGGVQLASAKGAPEAIFDLCRLPDDERLRAKEIVTVWADQGLRVLGVASVQSSGESGDGLPEGPFRFAGLVAFVDPLRVGVAETLKVAHDAGIKVVMITGDHPATGLAIARQAGMNVSAGALTGSQVAALSTDGLRTRIAHVRVFARVQPEQKLRIVEAFRADGEIVAMTGDGVNDAPALEAAHIGIAMGRKGTDVAREAADLVLLDDSFNSIVGGVRLGRRIYANLRQALIFVTAVHVPIAGLALVPILLGLPPLLYPMHVVLLELVIDPICALVFEAETSSRASMRHPPRRPSESLFGLPQLARAGLQGAGVLAAVLAIYLWALPGFGEMTARGAAFACLISSILILALSDSASSGKIFTLRRWLYWAIAGTVFAALALILAVPLIADIFSVAMPPPAVLAITALAAMLSGGWPGIIRWLQQVSRNKTSVALPE